MLNVGLGMVHHMSCRSSAYWCCQPYSIGILILIVTKSLPRQVFATVQIEPVEDAIIEYVVGAESCHARLDLKSERALYEFLWT